MFKCQFNIVKSLNSRKIIKYRVEITKTCEGINTNKFQTNSSNNIMKKRADIPAD